jgi:branched-chain amino acid transport system permease protein
VAMQSTFAKLGADHTDLAGLFDFLSRLATVAPALLGVSIGRNPTGAVEEAVVNWEILRRARPVLVAGAGVFGIAYLLARGGAISNWWLVAIGVAVAVTMPLAARRLVPAAQRPGAEAADAVAATAPAGRELPLELVGVERPYTEADRLMLDTALGLPGRAGAGRG